MPNGNGKLHGFQTDSAIIVNITGTDRGSEGRLVLTWIERDRRYLFEGHF